MATQVAIHDFSILFCWNFCLSDIYLTVYTVKQYEMNVYAEWDSESHMGNVKARVQQLCIH